MDFLEIKNLSKRYGSTEVLKDIDISVEEGGFLVLVGPSGCGKSTLLNMIAGLETVTAGEISIGGRRVNELRPSQRDIAMVFQSYALYPNMNVERNLSFGLEMRRISKTERDKAVADVARILQIEHLLKRKPAQLSGGQRQRVAMGRALVRYPQVFLFDEPLSNLDAKLRVDMRTEIKRLHQRLGTTIVYVTHDQIEAMTLATKIAVLRDGIMQQVATPAEIYSAPANMFVASFMGSPAMNLIPATVMAQGDQLSLLIKGVGPDPVRLSLSPGISGLAARAGTEIVVGIRPEAIFAGSGEATARRARVECLVDVVEPAGADMFVILRLGDQEVTARLPAETSIKAGAVTQFDFAMDRAVFFDPKTTSRIA